MLNGKQSEGKKNGRWPGFKSKSATCVHRGRSVANIQTRKARLFAHSSPPPHAFTLRSPDVAQAAKIY